MPPKTRSKGQAPASGTYHSSPAPQQATFPSRRRVIKTYGRRSTSVRSLRQQTLTQLEYVTQNSPDGRDVLEDGPIEEPADGKSKKRRKTMGDTPSSSFHTQTLTQFLSEKSWSGKGGDGDDSLLIQFSEVEDGGDLAGGSERGGGDKESSLVPETPSNQKIKVNLDEVPSSLPTPFTPRLERYSPGSGRSPLLERSTNVDAPPPTGETINKIPRNITIQDTFSPSRSPFSSMPVSSIRDEVTPTNRPRRQPLAEISTPSLELRDASAILGESPMRSGKENRKRAFIEIPDSDDDLSSFSPTPLKLSSVSRTSQRAQGSGNAIARPSNAAVEDPIAEEGIETTPSEDGCPGTPTPLARRVHIEHPPHSSPSVFEETPQRPRNKSSPTLPQTAQRNSQRQTQRQTQRNTQRNTQRYTQRQTQRSHHHSQGLESQRVPMDIIHSLAPLTDQSDILISIRPESVEAITNGTKDHEFRSYKFPAEATRCWIYTTLPVGEVKYMATLGPPKQPGEIDSDTGIGNAQFNNRTSGYSFAYHLVQVYQLNNPVPLALMKQNGLGDNPPQKWRHVPTAIVGQLLGNLRCALFDEGDEEEEEEDNLIRGDTPNDSDDEVDPTISRELEKQIHDDIIRSTQMHSSEAAQDEIIPESQAPLPRSKTTASAMKRKPSVTPKTTPPRDDFALPPLPATAMRSSSRIQSKNRRQQLQRTPSVRRPGFVRPSQATTASQASTPAISPGKSSVPRPVLGSSVPSDDFPDGGSPIRLPRSELSLGSSQPPILDSLLVDEVRPPPEILDSDDDDDDYDGS